MKYIICVIAVIITLLIIYKLNLLFEPKIKTSKKGEISLNIKSDYIVVLSQENCPYCKILEERIKDAKGKHTVITLTNSGTFKYDNYYTDMDIHEREDIINEVKKIFDTGMVYFPVILYKTKIINGLPKPEEIDDLFN
jgi:glutaredoxin